MSSQLKIAVDPYVLRFASSYLPPEDPFWKTFNRLFPQCASQTGDLCALQPAFFIAALVIIRQPVPAKHRRNFIEVLDTQALFNALLAQTRPALQVPGESRAYPPFNDLVIITKPMSGPDFDISSTGNSSMLANGSTFSGASPATTVSTFSHGSPFVLCQMDQIHVAEGSRFNGGGETSGNDMHLGVGSCGIGSLGSGYNSSAEEDYGNPFSFDAMVVSSPPQGNHVGSMNIYPGFMESPSQSMDSATQNLPHMVVDALAQHGQHNGVRTATIEYETADDGDDGDDNDSEQEEDPCRPLKKSRTHGGGSPIQYPYLVKPESFRASKCKLTKEVQYETLVVAYVNPRCGGQTDGRGRQEEDSEWGELVSTFLDSRVMKDFVRDEVTQGRIGVDYKPYFERDCRKNKRTAR
ncbi:hypothetical protein BGZ65_001547 [Modicella reniformis]|uniref:Uncharacterized protein n=1 Tax=Modicella reniformis TaxID=1440133 RepID=A0A9P6J294_9FUNG|nr:hypothetical protein BGZ65_001547 [Modicella reniformis]